jgi:hypothetical protein
MRWLARRSPCGQSALEYVLLLVAAIVAAVGLRTYVRLVIQGRLNDARVSLMGESVPLDVTGGGQPYTWDYRLDTSEVTSGKVVERTDSFIGDQKVLAARADVQFTEKASERWGP